MTRFIFLETNECVVLQQGESVDDALKRIAEESYRFNVLMDKAYEVTLKLAMPQRKRPAIHNISNRKWKKMFWWQKLWASIVAKKTRD